MEVSSLVWGLTILMFVGLLAFEFKVHAGHSHIPSLKEAGIWTIIYLVAAVAFMFIIWPLYGKSHAIDYVAGYVTERALSIDNLFVFILIMNAFRVPRDRQEEVMLFGVVVAIILRGIFIALGAAMVERFAWIFYIFGIFLIYTAVKLLDHSSEEDEEYHENSFVRLMRRIFPVTEDYMGGKAVVRLNGKLWLTPLALVMLAIGSTDVLFAFDSIPAIFGLTQQPYLVFTANAWALMGMIQLYFLLGGLLERLVYLSYGLSFILAWIGVKLIIHAMHENRVPFINGGNPITAVPEIGTGLSLGVIVLALVIAAFFSLRATRGLPSQPAIHEEDFEL